MSAMSEAIGLDNGFDALDYNYADSPALNSITIQQGDKGLWCAVIQQAFIDMSPQYFAGKDTRSADIVIKQHPIEVLNSPRKERREAAHWLLYDIHDFDLVCSLAGVSPAVIRRAARRFIAI